MPADVFNTQIQLLPDHLRNKIRAYRRWQDAHASLLGKLMLKHAFSDFGFDISLGDIQYNTHGKPYFDGQHPFSIAHCDQFVVCVVSSDMQTIGLDVEKIQDVDVCDFRHLWRDDEWDDIMKGGSRQFLRSWTRKEAVVKAEGLGLYIPFQNVRLHATDGVYNQRQYFFYELTLDGGHLVTIASEIQKAAIDCRLFSLA